MRADEDLLVFVGARWPTLVRTLVLLGCPVADAPGLATDALSRCRRGWGAERRDGDVDAVVVDELVRSWERHRRAGSAEEWSLDPDVGVALAALGPERRRSVVLTRYAGRPGATTRPGPGEQELRDAVEEVPVLAPPTLAELDDRDRQRRRRTARRAAAVLVPIVLVVVGLTWWTTRGDEPPREDDTLRPAPVTKEVNPLPVDWYADGTLHLARAELTIDDGVTEVVALRDGAVYADDTGLVVHVADDGTRSVLGRKDLSAPLVASADNGWAAWVDLTGAAPRIVVDDAAIGRRIASLPVERGLSQGPRLVAVDGTTVFYRDSDGAHAWLPLDGTVVPVTPVELLDVRSRIRAFQGSPSRVQVVPSLTGVASSLPGSGAALAPDGDVVATRLDASGYGRIALYDTGSGEPLPTGLEGTEVALDLSLGDRLTVTYVVARSADMTRTGPFLRGFSGGELELRTCDLNLGSCETLHRLPASSTVPVLAR